MNDVRRDSGSTAGARSVIPRGYIAAAIVVAAAVLLLLRFPASAGAATLTARSYVLEMATILPAVMVLVGLFGVFVSRERVAKYVGKASGARGVVMSVVAGALPTGPLYIAFPLASALLRKGASVSNVIIMLSAWACIKLPQELMELQFLGFRFMVTRLVLTIACVVPMGFLVERLLEWSDRRRGAAVR